MPFLVAAPAAVVANWEKETMAWLPRVSVITYKGPAALRESQFKKLVEALVSWHNIQVLGTTKLSGPLPLASEMLGQSFKQHITVDLGLAVGVVKVAIKICLMCAAWHAIWPVSKSWNTADFQFCEVVPALRKHILPWSRWQGLSKNSLCSLFSPVMTCWWGMLEGWPVYAGITWWLMKVIESKTQAVSCMGSWGATMQITASFWQANNQSLLCV